jgi:hypothetical protein
VPESYLRAIFGSHLASRFVYEFGNNPSQFAFFDLYVSVPISLKVVTNNLSSMTKRLSTLQ